MKLFQSVMHDMHADVLFKKPAIVSLISKHGKGFYNAFKQAAFENVLVSYYYLGIKTNIKNREPLKGKFFFLDSGAYTASTQGQEICAWIFCWLCAGNGSYLGTRLFQVGGPLLNGN